MSKDQNKGISGGNSLSASQVELLLETLETVTTALSSLVSQLGEVLVGMGYLQISLTRLNESLQSNYRKEVAGVSGLRVVENLDSDENGPN